MGILGVVLHPRRGYFYNPFQRILRPTIRAESTTIENQLHLLQHSVGTKEGKHVLL